MEDKIIKIADQLKNSEITLREAYVAMLEALKVPNEILEQHGLKIIDFDYGTWQLWEGEDLMSENELFAVQLRAWDIIYGNKIWS